MGLVRGALIGFGFLRSAPPGAATRRGGSRTAVGHAGCVALPHRARRPVGERRCFVILTV